MYRDLNRGRSAWFGEYCIRKGIITPEPGDEREARWAREGWTKGRDYRELETWDEIMGKGKDDAGRTDDRS